MKIILKEYLVVLLLFFLIAGVATYPTIVDFSGHIVGTHGSVDSGDAYIVSWIYWWFEFARTNLGVSPFTTVYQFYPYTIELIGEVSILYAIVGGVITQYFGFVAAYNARVFFSFMITGVTSYFCFKRLGNSQLGAISGAIAFTFSYYHVIRATQGHIDLASTEWYGLLALGIFSAMKADKVRRSMVFFAVAGLTLTGYTDFRNFSHLLHFTVVSTVMFAIVYLIRGMYRRVVMYLGFVCISVGLAGAILSPLVYFSILHYPLGSLIGSIDPTFIPDIRVLIVPPTATFLSWILTGQKSSFQWVSEIGVVYLGIPVFISMMSLYLIRGEKHRMFYWLIASVGAMYICLMFFGWDSIYRLLYPLYVFRPLIVTSRFVVVVHLCLALLTAIAVTKVEQRSSAAVRICLWIIPFLLFIDTLVMPVSTIDAHNVSEIVALKSYPMGTVLELPFSFRTIHKVISGVDNNISLLHQTFHEKPLIGGYMTTLDLNIWRAFAKDSLLIKLAQCQDEGVCESLSEEERKRFLSLYRVRYLIVPKAYMKSSIAYFLQKSFAWDQVSIGHGYQVLSLSSTSIY